MNPPAKNYISFDPPDQPHGKASHKIIKLINSNFPVNFIAGKLLRPPARGAGAAGKKFINT
jgi:hypothetical protein